MEFIVANWTVIVVVLSSLYVLPPLCASAFFWIKLNIWISFNPESENLSQYSEAVKINKLIMPLRRVGLFFIFLMFFFVIFSTFPGAWR